MQVGFKEGLSYDESRSNWDADGPRPLKWSAWYPAVENAVAQPMDETSWFQKRPVARDAKLLPTAKPYPLVLMSHGTGGVAGGLDWLGHRLAQRGFVALAVNHHGNTGTEPYQAEGFLCLWERARDLSVLLDDTQWRKELDGQFEAHAHIAGFSAGAYAAMLLLGARVAYSQFEAANPIKSPLRGPKEFPDLADQIPILLERNAVFREAWERRSASYADDRFRSALLLAPGRSVLGFSRESLEQVGQPIRIVVGSGDTIAPAAECSSWLHRHVPNSELEILKSGAGHYVFLPEPTALGMKEASDVFPDADSVDRRRIHDHVSLVAARLFGGTA